MGLRIGCHYRNLQQAVLCNLKVVANFCVRHFCITFYPLANHDIYFCATIGCFYDKVYPKTSLRQGYHCPSPPAPRIAAMILCNRISSCPCFLVASVSRCYCSQLLAACYSFGLATCPRLYLSHAVLFRRVASHLQVQQVAAGLMAGPSVHSSGPLELLMLLILFTST